MAELDGIRTHLDNALLTPGQFLAQEKLECHFSKVMGQEQVCFLQRHFYYRQETNYFDSDLDKFVAVTPLGEHDVELWNSQKERLEYRREAVDTFCWHNYGVAATGRMVGRRELQYSISFNGSPLKSGPNSRIHTINGYY
ncbi:HLA class II histocompatibility antigen, DR beta 5 chain-like [Varanus komodoensis]|uniref:HLA class II histocompatibility antigen, DR beta 5 chain-like n=1 Tax=Varanus komodoensis TaxID=61221 RepID=UPI001CF7994D|nr:HLA class II histocompatibility antigen, DR beta 5 chain-like [Varanus komodoensis]